MSAAVPGPASRRRPAPDLARGDAKKRSPQYSFGSIDEYELLEVLGEGADGVVRKARYSRTGKKFALKWLRGDGPDGHGPPDRRALAMEAGCLYACRGHPSIIGIEHVVADADTGDVHLVLEFVGGTSLRDNIYKCWQEDIVRSFMRQLVDAAKKIHDVGFIHRDIKPENILNFFGGLKLCDFGWATRQKPPGMPHEERRVGTLQYNSPEQLAGSRCYGPAVDMWALGCVMGELLSGGALFPAETKDDMIAETSVLRDRGIAALECSEELSEAGREVLAGLLAFCPDQRLTAAQAMEHRWFAKKT